MKAKITSRRGIIFLTPAEYTDEKEAQEILDFGEKFLAKNEGSFPMVINFNGYRGHDPNVRAMFGNFLREKKDRALKIAIVAPKMDKLTEIAIMTIFALGGSSHFRFFKDETEAVKWVKEK